MKKTFMCICKDHLLKIDYIDYVEWTHTDTKKIHKEKNVPQLWVGIYQIHSIKNGRKLKKPKLIADFEVWGYERDTKEIESLMKFLEKIVMKWVTREKK